MMKSEYHNTIISYEQLDELPGRSELLEKAIVEQTDSKIKKVEPIFFMPNCVYDKSLQDRPSRQYSYKLVMIGVLKDGRKATVILNGINPYFCVRMKDSTPESISKDSKNLIQRMKDYMDTQKSFDLEQRLLYKEVELLTKEQEALGKEYNLLNDEYLEEKEEKKVLIQERKDLDKKRKALDKKCKASKKNSTSKQRATLDKEQRLLDKDIKTLAEDMEETEIALSELEQERSLLRELKRFTNKEKKLLDKEQRFLNQRRENLGFEMTRKESQESKEKTRKDESHDIKALMKEGQDLIKERKLLNEESKTLSQRRKDLYREIGLLGEEQKDLYKQRRSLRKNRKETNTKRCSIEQNPTDHSYSDEFIDYKIFQSKPFVGYQKHKDYYLQLNFRKTKFRKMALKYIMKEEKLETVDNDMTCYYRVVGRDNKLKFCCWSKLYNYTVYNHGSHSTDDTFKTIVFRLDWGDFTNYDGDISKDHYLTRDRSLSLCWDIETYNKNDDGDIPQPENKDHCMFMIGITIQWYWSEETLLEISITDERPSKHKDFLGVVCETEEKIIKAFGIIVEKFEPEFILGFNDAQYDWPWLINRGYEYPKVISHLANKMTSIKLYQPDNEMQILKFNYNRQDRIKVEADAYAEGYSLKMDGYINIDVRTEFRRLFPTAEKTSLNHFLQINKLPSKEDMPYLKMFRIYREILSYGDTIGTDSDKLDKYKKLQDEFALVSKYCVVDAKRCNTLMIKKNVIMDRREFANKSYTTLFGAFYRANGSKVRNLAISIGKEFGYQFDNQCHGENKLKYPWKYPGAYVMPPKKGLYKSKLSMRERRDRARELRAKREEEDMKDSSF